MHIVIIGGGAAGFFCAINVARLLPDTEVTILEKTSKLLGKVRISGGGRCNVTNAIFDAKELVRKYPRGEKEMLGPFHSFHVASTIEWFKQRGVLLKTEPDGRMFPITNSSETIIDCFMKEAQKLGIRISINTNVTDIQLIHPEFKITTGQGLLNADFIVVATGGNTNDEFKEILKKLGHTFTPSVPSLFTFNVPNHPVNHLMGVSVPNAVVKIANTRLHEEGPLLITHWGFSGPVILRLSAWGARHLADVNYNFMFSINWLGYATIEEINSELLSFKQQFPGKSIQNHSIDLPKRLWQYMINKCGIAEDAKWQNASKQQLQKLALSICKDEYNARGKTMYKDEFVTCGGVNLKEIEFKTMQSKLIPHLYFAGEVMDVDGITGGFNFQNAWTTAWIAANSIANPSNN